MVYEAALIYMHYQREFVRHSVAINFRAKIDFFIDQVFNYPTYAEGYRIAALNGINKIKRLR